MAESQQVKLGDIFYVPLSEEDDVTPKGGLIIDSSFVLLSDFQNMDFM